MTELAQNRDFFKRRFIVAAFEFNMKRRTLPTWSCNLLHSAARYTFFIYNSRSFSRRGAVTISSELKDKWLCALFLSVHNGVHYYIGTYLCVQLTRHISYERFTKATAQYTREKRHITALIIPFML